MKFELPISPVPFIYPILFERTLIFKKRPWDSVPRPFQKSQKPWDLQGMAHGFFTILTLSWRAHLLIRA